MDEDLARTPLNTAAHRIYERYRPAWKHLERSERLADDRPLDIGGARIAIVGMGRIGTAAYDQMRRLHGGAVVGVDSDPQKVRYHQTAGHKVLLGDPRDGDFWDRVQSTRALDVVMLALPNRAATLAVLDRIKDAAFEGRIAAAARFPDEIEAMHQAGASILFNLSAEAGSGFAEHVAAQIPPLERTGAAVECQLR